VGPNIFPPPEQKPLPNVLAGRVLIVAPDDISTGDLSPDGATVMAYRSNVPAIAEFTFQHRGQRVRQAGARVGWRLHRRRPQLRPGLEPGACGARSGPAWSQSRDREELRAHPPPHLIAQGIVPLLFRTSGLRPGRAGPEVGDPRLHSIAEGEDELQVEIEGAPAFTVTHDFLPREREVVVAGGLIRYLKAQQPAGV